MGSTIIGEHRRLRPLRTRSKDRDAAQLAGTAAICAERTHLGESAVSCTRMPLSSRPIPACAACCRLAAWRAAPPPRRIAEEAGLCPCCRCRVSQDHRGKFLAAMHSRTARCHVQPHACRAAGAAIKARLQGCRPWPWLIVAQASNGRAKDCPRVPSTMCDLANAAARWPRRRPDGTAA